MHFCFAWPGKYLQFLLHLLNLFFLNFDILFGTILVDVVLLTTVDTVVVLVMPAPYTGGSYGIFFRSQQGKYLNWEEKTKDELQELVHT